MINNITAADSWHCIAPDDQDAMSDIGGDIEHMVAWSLITAPGWPLIIVRGVVINWCGALYQN